MNTIDWQPSRPPRKRRGRIFILALLAIAVLGGGTALSYYVEALWFNSLGFGSVFWTTLNIQGTVFAVFTAATFFVLYGSLLALRPDKLGDLTGGNILINGQPVRLPVGPVLRVLAGIVALFVSVLIGFGMMAQWQTLALYWYGGPAGPADALLDPVFGRPVPFYLFTLPAWQLVGGWMTTVAVLVCIASVLVAVVTSGTRVLTGRLGSHRAPSLRAVSISFAAVLLMVAWQIYVGRFARIFVDGRIFDGINYTQAHVTLTGTLIVVGALVLGALVAGITAFTGPKARWLIASVAPAIACYVGVGIVGSYVSNFVVKPNELVRERPFITHNIELTRRAYQLDLIDQKPFPAESGIEAVDAANNAETLQNIRLWDWRALQDTLRQIQEIRTYYDFPDIDIDRYEIDGSVRQMMLAVRELNTDRLPESSRGWINEKLIYTHGYGITMNPVNGFTPEGLPALLVKDMPVQSTVPALTVSRPEIYYGELTNNDVYVRTTQKEFNFPQGESNSTTSYEGTSGIVLGGFVRKLLIALDRGDLTKLPFSDAITPDSRLLMRRNIRERVVALADFLTFDPDPYIVVGDEGRLFWMMDAFTTSDTYPYASHTRLGNRLINYARNSVKTVIDAYDGSVTFYVFDSDDPVLARYRTIFPALFKDASAMPPTLRKHVRYPELLLDLQAAVYGLYHMTNPDVFYNREDMWSVASEVSTNERRETAAQTMEANFVLMKLPGEKATEFIEILPFTPANRNNLIGWIAGRSDDPHYGKAIVYDFPKTRLVDGPLQIEARIDQNPQLSGQLSLWNQEGSHVRRGALIVIPVGKALLYAEPIYLQAERSPMPELRLVVLALQDRLAYGPTFEAAMSSLFGASVSTLPTAAVHTASGGTPPAPSGGTTTPAAGLNALIAGAARDLEDYQRLTSEGKLGEAGQKLEALKSKLEQLVGQRP